MRSTHQHTAPSRLLFLFALTAGYFYARGALRRKSCSSRSSLWQGAERSCFIIFCTNIFCINIFCINIFCINIFCTITFCNTTCTVAAIFILEAPR